MDDLMKKKRLQGLKEQILNQNLFKKWIMSEKIVCTLTMTGLAVNIIYHINAFHYLVDYCD